MYKIIIAYFIKKDISNAVAVIQTKDSTFI